MPRFETREGKIYEANNECDLGVSATGAAAAAVTATLPAVVGEFIFISEIQIVKYYSTAGSASATPVLVTTTNLPGSPVFTFDQSVKTLGETSVQVLRPATPIKASAVGTAVTVVCPAQADTLWRVNVKYYTLPDRTN